MRRVDLHHDGIALAADHRVAGLGPRRIGLQEARHGARADSRSLHLRLAGLEIALDGDVGEGRGGAHHRGIVRHCPEDPGIPPQKEVLVGRQEAQGDCGASSRGPAACAQAQRGRWVGAEEQVAYLLSIFVHEIVHPLPMRERDEPNDHRDILRPVHADDERS